MSDPVFQQAFARVRSRYSDVEWQSRSGRDVVEEVYREIRIIDTELKQASRPNQAGAERRETHSPRAGPDRGDEIQGDGGHAKAPPSRE
jgi:hypothetical protein